MSRIGNRVEGAFKAAGLRLTPQRYAVLDFLARRKLHATAEEIFRAINRNDPRASRATVYNSLHGLVRAGLAREVPAEGTAARFDAALDRHHHFLCEGCGGLEDVPWFEIPAAAGRAPLGARLVRDYEVIFRGACERCAAPCPDQGGGK